MGVRSLAFVVLLPVLGCGPSVRSDSDWIAQRDSTGFLSLLETPGPCIDCIEIERVAELGDTEGPGFVWFSQGAVQDHLGRYWVHQEGEIKVFGRDGQFLRTVGRAGEGPMEWRNPLPIHVDKHGGVHIIDQENNRETVLSSDFKLRAESRIPSGEIRALAPILDSGRYAASMWLMTEEAHGYPLHILEGAKLVRSFGATGGRDKQNHHNSRRRVAVDALGRIFSAKENEHEIEVWTREGERIGGLKGPVLNELEVKPTFYNRIDNPLPNKIIALQAIDSTKLIVVSRRPVEDWRDHYNDRVIRTGEVQLVLKEGSTYDQVYTGRVEVIDLRTRTILARQDFEEDFFQVIGPRVLLQERLDDLAHPRFVVWSLGVSLNQGPH